MKKAVAAIAFALVLLLVLSLPAMAYTFKASDFKTSVTVKINGNEYSANEVNGTYVVNHYCYGHEKVSVVYTVEPLIDITNKKFTVQSDMLNSSVIVLAYYNELNVPYKPPVTVNGINYTTSELPSGPTNEGPYKVVFTVNGTLPIIDKVCENLTVFRLYIENGSKDCFPPVVIRIINKDKLENYISQLKSEIQKLKSELSSSEAQSYLSKAENDISAANTLYQSDVYDKAYQNAVSAEQWLNKAKEVAKKTEAENIIDTLKTRIDLLKFKIQQIEGDLYKVGSKVSSNQLAIYINQKSDLSQKCDQYSNKLNDLQNLFDKGNYSQVISQGKSLLNSVNKTIDDANALLNKLESVLSPQTNTTATATATPAKTPETKLPSIKFNTTTLGIIGGVVIVVMIVAVLLYMRGGGRFDELK